MLNMMVRRCGLLTFRSGRHFRSFSSSRCNSTKLELDADVVIVGGGMVGSSLACALSSHPVFKYKKICLLEGSLRREVEKVCQSRAMKDKDFSNRVSALNPASARFLTGFGAWELIENSKRLHPFTRMFVWDECCSANIEFTGNTDPDSGDEVMAYMVENEVTVAAIAERLNDIQENSGNLQVLYSSKISSCHFPENSEEFPFVELEDGSRIRARLLIGADGVNSVVRGAMGGHYFAKDYEQMGVVGTITFQDEFENDTAFQKFMTTGPIAVLPVSNKKSSLVWTVPRSWAKAMTKELTPEQFASKLNAALSDHSTNYVVDGISLLVGALLRPWRSTNVLKGRMKPPKIERVDNLAAFPVGAGLPERSVSPKKAVLVGDAFHRVHPLAGQGVNLGFGDARTLVEKLADSIRTGLPVGDYGTLCDYETERLRHNLPTMLAIDGLQKLYCTDNTLLVLARSFGLQVVNSSDTLKRLAAVQASN